MIKFPEHVSIGEKYGPAMQIHGQQAADEYFEACVEHNMRLSNYRAEAERIERINLGYYAGYYDSETRERVERLFKCEHPIFGKISERGSPTPEEAYEAGRRLAQRQVKGMR